MNITTNPFILNGDILYFWTHEFFNIYLPVTYSVWTVLFALSQDPMAFHVLNYCLHALNIVLVFELTRQIWPQSAKSVPWFAALFFAIHPLQTETVSWISGTRDLLGATFSIASALVMLRSPRLLEQTIAFGLFVLALLSKPTVAPFPVAIFALAGLRGQLKKTQIGSLALGLLAAAVVAVINRKIQAPIAVNLVEPIQWYQHLLIAMDSIGFFLQKMLVPYPLTGDYGRTPPKVLGEQLYWITVILFWTAVFATLWIRKYRPQLAWEGMLFFPLALAPLSGIVPFMAQSQSTVADRYFYWAWIGPAILLAQLFASNKVLQRAAVLVLLIWAALSMERSFIWRDNRGFFANMLAYTPESYVGNNSMGVINFNDNRVGDALINLERARERIPYHPTAVSNIAQVYLMQNRPEEVIKRFAPLTKDPVFPKYRGANPDSFAKVFRFVGIAQKSQGQLLEASDNYCIYFKLAPWDKVAISEYEALLREIKVRTGQTPPCLELNQ